MEVMHAKAGGLDVHNETVVACARLQDGRRVTRECRTYGTVTATLIELREWLAACGCTVVAMEATGVYWLPVWKVLSEGPFELILANARHIKNVPGRKTDMNDAMWIADLAAHGLIRPSFVPDEEFQELRTLTRTRKQLVQEQTRHVQRLQKTLQEANIKLDGVISDIMGASGRRMIEAIIAGESDPHRLALMAERSVKATPPQLFDALRGRVTEHHRFLLRLHLRHYDALDQTIRELCAEIDARIERLDAKRKAEPPPFAN
jgi:transposase